MRALSSSKADVRVLVSMHETLFGIVDVGGCR